MLVIADAEADSVAMITSSSDLEKKILWLKHTRESIESHSSKSEEKKSNQHGVTSFGRQRKAPRIIAKKTLNPRKR